MNGDKPFSGYLCGGLPYNDWCLVVYNLYGKIAIAMPCKIVNT